MTLSTKLVASMKKVGMQIVTDHVSFNRLSTGFISLDYALGGGLIQGGLTTLSGFSTYGKTTLASLICMNRVNAGGSAVIVDTERSIQKAWLSELGDGAEGIDLLQGDQRTSGENYLEIITQMVSERSHEIIVLDSIAATTFAAEKAASMSDTPFAIGARKWAEFCRKINAILADSDVVLLMTNHARPQMDKYAPDIEYGGRWVGGFTPVTKLKMMSPVKPKEGEAKPLVLRPYTAKNKGFRFRRDANITLYPNGKGGFLLDPVPDLVEVGKNIGVFTFEDGSPIKGNGVWYFNGQRLVNGAEKVSAMLDSDDALQAAVHSAVYERMYITPTEALTNDNDFDGDNAPPAD